MPCLANPFYAHDPITPLISIPVRSRSVLLYNHTLRFSVATAALVLGRLQGLAAPIHSWQLEAKARHTAPVFINRGSAVFLCVGRVAEEHAFVA
jgi:hypothetical protein